MAPKKDKAEKVSASAMEEQILRYLEKQNRPYSVTDISANLQVPKSAAQKILIKLQEAKQIEGRVAGKQSVFHAVQNPENTASPEALAQMDERTQLFTDELTALDCKIKALRSSLSQLESSLSTADLRSQVAEMTSEKAEIEARLVSLKSGSVQPVSREEKESVDGELRAVKRAVGRRAAIVKDMWGNIAESWQGEKVELEELREEFDLEM